jgi:hypothetical protein
LTDFGELEFSGVTIGEYYTPRPVQRKFHESEATYPLMEGGRGGGKSMALLWEAISECLLVPGWQLFASQAHLDGRREGRHRRPLPEVRAEEALSQLQSIEAHRAEFLFIGWEELTQFTYSQWDFMKGSNRCPIKPFKLDGHTYETKPRIAGGTNPNGKGSGWVKAL